VTSPLVADDVPFFLAFPDFLASGSFSGPIFRIDIPGATAPGLYPGTVFISGGLNTSANQVLATQTFAVSVQAAPVPEPGAASLLLVGGCAAIWTGVRRRGRRYSDVR